MSAAETLLGRAAVFAGTTEGHDLCRALSAAGREAVAFVATPYGAQLLAGLPGIEVRAGRLDEAAMREALAGFDVAVDATHPYAAEASRNLRAACAARRVRYLRLLRPPSLAGQEGVVRVADASEAARFLAGQPGTALLTTGSKDLPTFAAQAGLVERLWARILPDPDNLRRALALGFAPARLICMQGPFSREMNVATLRMAGARWLVTKDAGAAGGVPEKFAAAREAGAGLVVLDRPAEPGVTHTLEEVVALLVG